MSKGNYIFVWIHSIFHMSIYEFKRFGDQLNFSFCFLGGGITEKGREFRSDLCQLTPRME